MLYKALMRIQNSSYLSVIDVECRAIEKAQKSASGRGQTNLYLDKNIYREFCNFCSEVKPSRVIEEFMISFLEQKKQEVVNEPVNRSK